MEMAGLDRSLERGLRSVVMTVWRHKVVATLAAAAGFAAVMVGALSLQPVYEGSTLLIGGQAGLEQAASPNHKVPDSAASLARVAESEDVVAEAVAKIGLAPLMAGQPGNRPSLFARARKLVFPSTNDPQPDLSETEAALPRIKQSLNVRGDATSDIIRIAYRNRDPVVAAAFANAVAQTFVDRQIALKSRPGAAAFFQRQRERFEEDVKRTSAELETFSRQTRTYAAEDQRQLLLRRLSDVEAALASTRGAISENLGRRQALADELRRLAPVAQSPFVSNLVDTLAPVGTRTDPRALDGRTSDPPLLLVRVYQDSMVALFKVNADLVASQGLQQQLAGEAAALTAQLDMLSANAERYAQLKRALDQANLNADLYTHRMIEEQIEAESDAAKFSSVKVVQKATVPLRPVFPNYLLVTGLAAVVGGVLGIAAAFLRSLARGPSARNAAVRIAGADLRSSRL